MIHSLAQCHTCTLRPALGHILSHTATVELPAPGDLDLLSFGFIVFVMHQKVSHSFARVLTCAQLLT